MRIVFVVLLIIGATLIGGIYGALYDQITYTVSNEFFTKRFAQAGISDTGLIRWEVAKIGFIKTWSVGFWLGLFLSLAGLLHEDNRKMFRVTLQAFLIALGTAFVFGIIAFFFVDTSADVVAENTVIDKESFNKVVCMNNYSYVGGIIGMFLGLGWQVLKTRLNKKK